MAELGEASMKKLPVEDEKTGLEQTDDALNKYKPWGMTGCVFLGHEYHITELLLGFFVVMALVCSFLALTSAGIPGLFYASMLLITSFIAMLVLWNYASIDTLAKLAARYARAAELYESLSEELAEENEKMTAQNEEFQKTNTELEGTVNKLWKDVGIVDTATADLNKILKGFDTLMETAKLMEKYEQDLNADQAEFLKFQRQRLLTNAKHSMKRRLRNTFDDVDVDRSGSLTGKETVALKRILKKDLPDVKDVDKVFDLDGDGIIKKWELMDACDTLLDKVFTVQYEEKNGKLKVKS